MLLLTLTVVSKIAGGRFQFRAQQQQIPQCSAVLWGTLQIPMLLKALLWTRSVRGNSQRPDQNPCLMFNFNSDFPSTFYKSVSELTNTEQRDTHQRICKQNNIMNERIGPAPSLIDLWLSKNGMVKILLFIQRRRRKNKHCNSQNQEWLIQHLA